MQTANTIKVFRYNLCDDIMSLITQFAQVHQADDRQTYKDAWQNWLITNRQVIDIEISRLNQLGYTGDVEDKMFKAGRYYFRGKVAIKAKTESAESAESAEKKTRDYVVMNTNVIQIMDRHLTDMMTTQNFRPATGFTHFCQNHCDILQNEITRLIKQNNNFTAADLSTKIKKTYKNRYYMLNKASKVL
jgi:hypothetical protein